jgi:endonuclease YncB( thermonuclease family)
VKALEATRQRAPSDAPAAKEPGPPGAPPTEPKTGGGEDRSVRWRDEALEFSDLDERFSERLPRLLGVAVILVLLAVVPFLAYSAFFSDGPEEEPVQDTVASAPAPESETTSSVPPQQATPEPKDASPPPQPSTAAAEPLKGVPEVLDTATLALGGKVIPLFGVEWVRGAGSPEELTRYLNGREVVCDEAPSPGTYRCQVDSQDLSKVVLYNGGGRAKPDATPELKAAEDAARSAGRGVWADSVGAAD